MKILFITNGFPPQRWAGTETHTAGLAIELQRRGHGVQVLCTGEWQTGPSYWSQPDDDCYEGVPVRRINVNWAKAPDPFRYLYDNPVVAKYLKSYLAELEPDLVHVTSCETLSASVLAVVKNANLPLILSLTDFWFLCPRINLLKSDGTNCDSLTNAWDCLRCQLLTSKAYRWPRRIASEHIVSSMLMRISKVPPLTRQRGLRGMAGDMAARKEFLGQAIAWPDVRVTASPFVRHMHAASGITVPIETQPYGHDLSWLAGYTGKSASDVVRFGFIGQLVESKGAHLLLQAAQSLPSQLRERLSISIYGNMDKDASYGERLRHLAADLPQVCFRGTYARADSAQIYAGLDILVVPSLWYDFPLVMHEAFATQTPVIATNLGGMAETVTPGKDGLLFERGNVDDLAKQLQRIIEVPNLLQLLRAGTPRVKRIDEAVNELESIYHDLIERRTKPDWGMDARA